MNFSHPVFGPYQPLIATLDLENGLPALSALNAQAAVLNIVQAQGRPLRFIAPHGKLAARDYETHILESGTVPTRADTWHDALNALVWLRYPRFKAALNAAHVSAMRAETGPARSRRRDALTMLDESGVWLMGEDRNLYELIKAHAWQTLFRQQRQAVQSGLRVVVVGHALLEKALAPYPAMTGKCLWLGHPADDEATACAALPGLDSPHRLAPLPVQGIPGWDAANADPGYYDNADVFRPARVRVGDTAA
ncbi:MAG TPA: DUF3025 domain-containing protein [Thiobacillus sp.]|uniref:DUF3025 domain-containing protein n=1 Tax=Polaromonas sp. TaxID=1869339 RepID=UPI000BDB75BF|nr:DUF3025 domain-containing protein [Polaromonas sp.]OYW62969.1 MAG: hypothetical protein B7Z32_13330 [Hydrogenophilales bacterium 12-64-13]OYZ04053.1 MAG: hypothetical protein B7Y26_13660 [Hydrogenophilales bacterium 16-64-46]OZA36692.1 MAG: hypothetical protein B7X87_13815 [Hydrogenophilales bacterium 17-64-34]HQS83103.1 DUF3025 domain-containing protein [Thiobacillus sp.]HQS89343.1 DUF3025 domain-containing protein [Polaromonas sp.]